MNITEDEKDALKKKWLMYSTDALASNQRANSQLKIFIASIIGLFVI
jgi:hypothetical protein